MCRSRALPGVGSGVDGARGAPTPLLARHVVMSKDRIGEKYKPCARDASDLASFYRLGSAERIVSFRTFALLLEILVVTCLLINPQRANHFRFMCRSEQLEQTET